MLLASDAPTTQGGRGALQSAVHAHEGERWARNRAGDISSRLEAERLSAAVPARTSEDCNCLREGLTSLVGRGGTRCRAGPASLTPASLCNDDQSCSQNTHFLARSSVLQISSSVQLWQRRHSLAYAARDTRMPAERLVCATCELALLDTPYRRGAFSAVLPFARLSWQPQDRLCGRRGACARACGQPHCGG